MSNRGKEREEIKELEREEGDKKKRDKGSFNERREKTREKKRLS